jgi:hypothetical protein
MNSYVESLVGKNVYLRVRLAKTETGYEGRLVTGPEAPVSSARIQLTEEEVERWALSWKQVRNNSEHSADLFKAGDIVRSRIIGGQCIDAPNTLFYVIGDEHKHKRLMRVAHYQKDKTYEAHITDPSVRTVASVFFELHKAFEPYRVEYDAEQNIYHVVKVNPYLHLTTPCVSFRATTFKDAEERAINYAAELNASEVRPAPPVLQEEQTEENSTGCKFIPTTEMKLKVRDIKCDHADLTSIQNKTTAIYGNAFTVLKAVNVSGNTTLTIRCNRCQEVFDSSISHFLHTGYMLAEHCPRCCYSNFERGVVTVLQRMRRSPELREVGMQILKDIENYPVTDRDSFIKRAEYIYGKDAYDYSAVHWTPATNGLSRLSIICKKHNTVFRTTASAWCDPRQKYREYAFGASKTCGCAQCAKELMEKQTNADA